MEGSWYVISDSIRRESCSSPTCLQILRKRDKVERGDVVAADATLPIAASPRLDPAPPTTPLLQSSPSLCPSDLKDSYCAHQSLMIR